MEMTLISECNLETCAFNKNRMCRTWGITVGPHGECNTFVHASARGGFPEIHGGLGACLASNCQFNVSLECRAANVKIALDDEKHADCKTYSEIKPMETSFAGYG